LRLSLLATTSGLQTRASEAGGRIAIRVAAIAGCPVEIIQKNTRVTTSLDLDPWERVRGKGRRNQEKREFGSGESHLTYHVAFRNNDRRSITELVVAWKAYHADGELAFATLTTHEKIEVASGQVQRVHSSELGMASQIERFTVEVHAIVFSDGSRWTTEKRN